MLKKRGLTIETCKIPPHEFASVIMLHYIGVFDRRETRALLEKRLDELHTK